MILAPLERHAIRKEKKSGMRTPKEWHVKQV